MAGSANLIQTHNVLRGKLSEDNVIAGTVGTGYNPTYALVGEAAAKIALYINSSDYKMYAELKDKNGNHIMNSNIIDLPLETMVVNGSYDSETKEVVLILDNGNELRFSVADLVRGLVSEEDLATTLGGYVKFTDYATGNNSGVIKVDANNYGINTNAQGKLYVGEANYQQYETKGTNYFIGKGTLENVITGKQLVNKTYVDEADEVFEEDLFGDASIIDSGESIILNNTIEKAPLSITLKGNTYQETTTGKNLLNTLKKYNAGQTITQDGITLKFNDDGSLTFNGTATNNVNIYITDTGNLFNLNGTYTLSCSDTDKNIMFFMWSGSSVQGGVNTSTTYTKENVTIDRLSVRAIGGNTFNNVTIYPQLEQGSSATSFEPYTNGASPNPDYPQEIEVVTGLNEVKVEGKNLFDKSTIVAGDVVNQNPTIRLSSRQSKYIEAGTYTISTNLDLSTYNYAFQLIETAPPRSNYTNIYDTGWISVSSKTITLTQSGYILFGIRKQNNGTLAVEDIQDYNFQLEKGSQATPYEAYKGQTYEVNLGKNLFDKDNANVLNAYIDNSTTVITENANNRIVWIKCNPNTTYTLQRMNSNLRTSVAWTEITPTNGVQTYGVTSANVGSNNVTITTGDKANYLVFRCYQGTVDSGITFDEMINSIQIEKSDTPTSYAPYFEPIELCKIGTYQDRIYKSNGNWYLHKEIGKVVLDGTNNAFASKSGQQGNSYTFDTSNFIVGPALTDVPLFLSDKFISKSWGERSDYLDSAIMFIYLTSTSLVFRFGTSSNITTLELANTWLSNNNVDLYGPLLNSTETQITDTTLINQLNALCNATSYDTQTNISQVNTNLSFILDISTFKNTTKGKIEALEQENENYEKLSNKVIELSSSSTDTEYPSAKCVYNLIGNIESILETLDIGNGV